MTNLLYNVGKGWVEAGTGTASKPAPIPMVGVGEPTITIRGSGLLGYP